jgi:translation initiation factor IF-1
MPKQDFIEYKGKVTKVIPGGKFLVQLENNHNITAHLSGKMRLNKINVLENDTVIVEVTPYDITQGRIVYRQK